MDKRESSTYGDDVSFTVVRPPFSSRSSLIQSSGYIVCNSGVFKPMYRAMSRTNATQLYTAAFHNGRLACRCLM
jgi:hypothetical protein